MTYYLINVLEKLLSRRLSHGGHLRTISAVAGRIFESFNREIDVS